MITIGQRTVDLFLVIPALILTSPIWTFVYLLGNRLGIKFESTDIIGMGGRRFSALSLTAGRPRWRAILEVCRLTQLPLLFNILKGDISWVGPRALRLSETENLDSAARGRFDVRPGLISLWSLRRRTNIDFENEAQIEQQYVDSKGVLSDIGILLRGMVTIWYGASGNTTLGEIDILGTRIHNLDMNQALDRIEQMLADLRGPAQIAFVNPHCANLAYGDPRYSAVLEESTLVLADGIGMKIAGRILGSEISQNVNGTDLFPRLCARLETSGKRVFFLGAEPGIPERVAAWTKDQFPGLIIAGFHHGYLTREEEDAVIQQIHESGADLILVAMGVPHQEIWISEHLQRLGTSVAMGVGGLFDFYSGKTPRAPQWLRELGLEWVYRFYREPRRLWRRYILGNLTFLAKVTVQALAYRYRRKAS